MSVNKVILMGRMGADVEGDPNARGSVKIARGAVAISKSYKDSKTGEWKDITDWVQLRFFDKLAERAIDKLKKGMEVYMEGEIKTWAFERNGKKEYATAVKVEMFYITKGNGAKQPAAAAGEEDYGSDNTPF